MITVQQMQQGTVLTLDRPEKANALTEDMLVDLNQAIAAADRARPLVITGSGAVFSAGADLADVRNGLATSPAWEALSTSIAHFPCLTIAALNGTVAGGAMGMVLACDLRFAVEKANFFYPVAKLGVLPQPSDPNRLSDLIGPARAKQILLLGRKINYQTAVDWGLVDAISDTDQIMPFTLDQIAPLSEAKPGHIADIKSLFTV